jgi:hypothetical protein
MEAKAAQAILEKPFRFRIRTGWFLRILHIRRISLFIYPIHYGTMVLISEKLQDIKTTTKEEINDHPVKTGFELIGQNARTLSRCIAFAVLNSKLLIFLFSRPLAWYFYWHLDSDQGAAIMAIVLERSRIGNFLNTIISLTGLNVTRPREMSPNGTGGTIAPGE